jgi:hypothetical protein
MNETDHISKVIIEQAHALIRECRNQCLWFFRDDYLPTDRDCLLRSMRSIENSGTRAAYIQARNIELCLLQDSKKISVI